MSAWPWRGSPTALLVRRQAHYAQVSARDAAMSRSLNSDYLGQLLIQVDNARLDARLVAAATQGAAVADEARALLVFKRGCAPRSPGYCI